MEFMQRLFTMHNAWPCICEGASILTVTELLVRRNAENQRCIRHDVLRYLRLNCQVSIEVTRQGCLKLTVPNQADEIQDCPVYSRSTRGGTFLFLAATIRRAGQDRYIHECGVHVSFLQASMPTVCIAPILTGKNGMCTAAA